ncbi:hypothetical protein DFP93_101319 [Aneurinibacillus soli]|uniref:Uncharacterized protein n=2 Tax=Aneurinibacillus soli TaxID=1500254 RepID=A0A0U5B0Y7_9BACL|nr:hypothetical protein [Aneurinibacillus soli]PYE64293.1 hypothetical protein DFP93_101319 [Aneurinibacillus soli]BAU28242.1 hypothetical protein CB4_02416 [Aneurinibacillus soli]
MIKMEYRLQVDEQGRVLIPEEVRDKLGYGPLSFRAEENKIVISEVEPDVTFVMMSKR